MNFVGLNLMYSILRHHISITAD